SNTAAEPASQPQHKAQPAPMPPNRSAPARAAAPTTLAPRMQAALPLVRLSADAVALASASLPAPVAQDMDASRSHESLPSNIRSTLEGSLNVSLASVRVHTDAHAAAAAEGLGARAFTYGTHIYFGARERPSDLALTAH